MWVLIAKVEIRVTYSAAASQGVGSIIGSGGIMRMTGSGGIIRITNS